MRSLKTIRVKLYRRTFSIHSSSLYSVSNAIYLKTSTLFRLKRRCISENVMLSVLSENEGIV